MTILFDELATKIQTRINAELSPAEPQHVMNVFLDIHSEPRITMGVRLELVKEFINRGYHVAFVAPSMRMDISLIIHRPKKSIATMKKNIELAQTVDMSHYTPYERDELITQLHNDGRHPHPYVAAYHLFMNRDNDE